MDTVINRGERVELRSSLSSLRGSMSLEAVLVLPFFLAIAFLLLSFLHSLSVCHVAEKALYQTAGILSDYAYFYHQGLLDKGEDVLVEHLGSFLPESEDLTSELWRDVTDFWQIREGVERLDDLFYCQLAEQIFRSCLRDQERLFSSISFAGSTFYNGDEQFVLHFKCQAPWLVTSMFPWASRYEIARSLVSRGWMAGDRWWSATSEPDSVWSLSPLKRGKELRLRFGGNLPEFYPVIARLEDGCVTMIKSLDHTRETYQSETEFDRTLRQMARQLSNFRGTEGNPSVAEHDQIKEGEIRKRILLLILPTNPTSQEQEQVLFSFAQFCAACGVQLEIERYQEVTP